MATVSFHFLGCFWLCFSLRLLIVCSDVTKTLGPAFYLVIASQTLCVKLTGGSYMAIQRQDLNRVALFLKVKQGQVLSGHVILTRQVRSEMECLHSCLSRDKCMSFNYGLCTSKSCHICELNSGSRKSPGHVFETSDRFSYYEPSTMTLPQQDFVFHNQSHQHDAESTVDAAVVMEAFLFPRKGVRDYVIVQGMPNLSELTACFWMRSSDQANPGTPLSYAVHGRNNEFTFLNYRSFNLYVGGKKGETDVEANDGKWHHICATWENTAGSLNVYKDGNLKKQQRLYPGHIISSGGSLVLGQDQDSVGGGFKSHQSFIGEMTGANIWSSVLGDQEIAALSKSCLTGEGNVFKWSDFKNHTRGGVRLINATCAA